MSNKPTNNQERSLAVASIDGGFVLLPLVSVDKDFAPEFPEGGKVTGLDGVVEKQIDSTDLFDEHVDKLRSASAEVGEVILRQYPVNVQDESAPGGDDPVL